MAAATGSPIHLEAPQGHACRSAWGAVGRFGLLVLAISLLLSVVALPWVHLPWWKIVRRCVSIAAAISVWLCITKFEGRSLRSYGFSAWGAAGKRQLLFGVLLGLGGLALMLGIGLAGGLCRIEVTPDRQRLWITALTFIPAAGLVGLLEELVFRGFLLQRLLACSTRAAVISSSAVYSLVHLKSPPWSLETSRELVGLFLLGLVLAVTYLRTRQLYTAVGLHAALAYGARVNKLLVERTDASLSWLVGTSRLVNGLMSWVAILVILGIVLWWTRPAQRGGVNHGHA